MKDEELKKYAELLIAISTDYAIDKIDGQHFINMVALVLSKINPATSNKLIG